MELGKDQKEFICVACGKTIIATKFASAKTIKCSDCKSAKKPINDSFIPKLVEVQKPIKEQNEDFKLQDNTKQAICIKCGITTTIGKFASASKALCENCKEVNTPIKHKPINISTDDIDLDLMELHDMPSISDYHIMPEIIKNYRLRSVQCPACGKEYMKIINIMDYSSFGLIIHYQCTSCFLLLNVSEQVDYQLSTKRPPGVLFDYSGNAIENIMYSSIESTRLNTSLKLLIEKCRTHNINIEGLTLPPYITRESKPVPIGYTIPAEDVWINTIEKTIQHLKNIDGDVDIITKLTELLGGNQYE